MPTKRELDRDEEFLADVFAIVIRFYRCLKLLAILPALLLSAPVFAMEPGRDTVAFYQAAVEANPTT